MSGFKACTAWSLTAWLAVAGCAGTDGAAMQPKPHVTAPVVGAPGAGMTAPVPAGAGPAMMSPGASAQAGAAAPAPIAGGVAPAPVAMPGMPPPAGAMAPPVAGSSAPNPMGTAGAGVMLGPGQTLPAVSDYAATGPFNPTMEVDNTGPDGMYTMYRPVNLDASGFKFSPLTWGNGITTTPQIYPVLLNTVASHGFIVIASNSSSVTPDMMTAGLDWLIAQNDSGELQGKLDVTRAVAMGYSLGGGGAVTAGAHKNVITTIAMHPAPGIPNGLHGPVLFFSGTADTVCIPETFVQPQFEGAPVPAFYALLDGADHLEPVLTGGRELAPSIAWLRMQVFGDMGARDFFYGASCTLCVSPWTGTTRNWN